MSLAAVVQISGALTGFFQNAFCMVKVVEAYSEVYFGRYQQVGRLESVCVIDVPSECEEDDETRAFNSAVEMPLVMFNPVVISTEGSQSGKEGCLSFPKLGGVVVRPDKVTCQYTDPRGMPQIITVRGFLARAVMHETDHLNGVLYVDRMDDGERKALSDSLERMAKKNGGVM